MFGNPVSREKPYLQKLRAHDEYVQKYEDFVRDQGQTHLIVNWLNKNEEIINKRIRKERKTQEMSSQEEVLERRRQELHELQKAEQEALKKEMREKFSLLSPTERKQNILAKLNALKEQKEKRRKEYVELQYDRALRRNNDEVRKFYHDVNEDIKIHDNQIQMVEKQNKLIEEYEYEQIYAEMLRRENMKRKREEEAKIQEARKKEADLSNIRAVQLEWQLQQSEREKKITELERARMKKIFDEEGKRLEEKSAQDQIQLRLKTSEMIYQNEEQKKIRNKIKAMEDEDDRKWISNMREKQKALSDLELKEKEAIKFQAKKYLSNFEDRNAIEKALEKEIEKKVAEESDKIWQKTLEKFKKADDKRVKLFHDVYDGRSKQLEEKRKRDQFLKDQKKSERQFIDSDLTKYEEELAERKRQELKKIMNNHSGLLEQISNNDLRKSLNLEEIRRRELAEKQAEMELQKRVDSEKAKGLRMMEEYKRRNKF